jgi:hypothetical protein
MEDYTRFTAILTKAKAHLPAAAQAGRIGNVFTWLLHEYEALLDIARLAEECRLMQDAYRDIIAPASPRPRI